MAKFNPFFPEFLNHDEEWDGPAVAMLQTWLRLLGYTQVHVDGDYGEVTTAAVAELQRKMGLNADGDFGPDTRREFFRWHNVDVNAISASLMSGKTKKGVRSESSDGNKGAFFTYDPKYPETASVDK